MRNLKRALSLALASVMLLGMMVVGSSAATFADEAEIVNKEAVQITAGMGLFAGSDGKFNPAGKVTRAQMATIITKMLYGSEINADQFKGTGSFNDTVAFEGGWAEGYINLCASLNIVKGYGDGTFNPGKEVTTAEAVTMIINALKVDAGEGTWPLTVMAKAEEMKLFTDLAVKPGTNVALTRDQLAVIVLAGLEYSPAGLAGYTVKGITNIVFADMADALNAAISIAPKVNGQPVLDGMIEEKEGEDALATTVFNKKAETGYVVANQATGDKYTTVRVGANNIEVALETGLDMIGHYVTVHYAEEYKSELEPGKAYCIVDEATYVTVPEAVSLKKDYQAAFGATALDLAATTMIVDGNYECATGAVAGYDKLNWTAAAGTYAVNEENKIVAFIAFPAVYADVVTAIGTRAGNEYITIGGTRYSNTEDNDLVVEYDGIAEEDVVTYVQIGTGVNATVVLTKPTTVEGQITKTFQNTDGDDCIIVNGTTYVQKANFANQSGVASATGLTLAPATINFEKAYTVYLTANGEMIGFKGVQSNANVSEVYYVKGLYTSSTNNSYGVPSDTTYAQAIDKQAARPAPIMPNKIINNDSDGSSVAVA